MIMQQAARQRPEDSSNAAFIIEATSHCRNGRLPRWTFLVQGTGSNARHGMIGTDEQGRGLYLYASAMAPSNARRQLVAPEDIFLPDTLSRQQANDEIIRMLGKLDWSNPNLTLRAPAPRFQLHAVS